MPEDMSLTSYGAASNNPGAGLTVIAQCPVANNLVNALKTSENKDKVETFIVNKMPLLQLPADIAASIQRTGKVLSIEEHISIGGLGSTLSLLVNEQALPVEKFVSLHAEGYPGGLYGSQAYHQAESGLDDVNIARVINSYF